jgi:hypothetical protein
MENKLTRSQIRYAIFRVRTGNATEEHHEIYAPYAEKLEIHGLDMTSFTRLWDIDPENPSRIVFGEDVKFLQSLLDESIVDEDGKEKDTSHLDIIAKAQAEDATSTTQTSTRKKKK